MRAQRVAALGAAAAVTGGALVAVVAGTASGATALTVWGNVAGTYTSAANGDTGHKYSLTAHGSTSLGTTKASATVQGPGNIRSGYCTARVVFTTSKGSITASVKSKKTFGSFALCQSGFAFAWHSVSATGSYAGHTASGTGTLTLVAPANASSNPPPGYITLDK